MATPIAVVIVGKAFNNAIGRATDKVQALEERVEDKVVSLERRLAKAEDELEQKVSAEEWIRESMRLRNSVDEMTKTLNQLVGKADATLQVAVAVSKLADKLGETKDAEIQHGA